MTDSKATAELKALAFGEPSIETTFIECKFTVESRNGQGGDWEKNIGGKTSDKRISFEGCATSDLYSAIVDAVRKMVDA